MVERLAQHNRDYYARLNELRLRHPHLPVHELERFLNDPPSEAPAKPTPEPTPRTMAQRIWPDLK